MHSIIMCEVKDTKSHVLKALGKIPNKKILLFCFFCYLSTLIFSLSLLVHKCLYFKTHKV